MDMYGIFAKIYPRNIVRKMKVKHGKTVSYMEFIPNKNSPNTIDFLNHGPLSTSSHSAANSEICCWSASFTCFRLKRCCDISQSSPQTPPQLCGYFQMGMAQKSGNPWWTSKWRLLMGILLMVCDMMSPSSISLGPLRKGNDLYLWKSGYYLKFHPVWQTKTGH